MAFGPCMCGAPDCPSCGPAQGYRKCELHEKWGCNECGEFAKEYGKLPDSEEKLKAFALRNKSENEEDEDE